MLEKSVFTEETIKEVLNQLYAIREVQNISKIERGSANIYEIKTNLNHYILKEFQSRYSSEEIKKEIDVINHLNKKGIAVPVYVMTKNGDYSFIYEGKTVILQEFIEGYTIEQNSGNYDQTIESAKNLALIVKALEDFSYQLPGGIVSNWYSEATFDSSIKKYKDLMSLIPQDEIGNKIKADFEEKISMIEDIKKNLNTSEMDKVTYKNTHGDYSMMQFIYKDGKINATIDFVAASYMPIVWEIVRSYSYIDKDCIEGNFNMPHFIDYVKEFNKYVELNDYDLKYMVYIYLVQLVNSNYGYKQYIYDNEKVDLLNFGFLRTKICRYLYNNAKEISDKLIEELR